MISLLATLSAWAKPPDDLEGLRPAEAPPAESSPATPRASDPLYDELLGATPPAETRSPMGSPPALGSAWIGLWPLGIAAAGAGLAWFATRGRRTGARGQGDVLVVVGRASVGTAAGLVLVDVKDPAGQWRRLLVGTGGTGVPTLVADLGEDEPRVELPELPAPSAARMASFTPPPAMRLPERRPTEPRSPPTQRRANFLPNAAQKAQARELIAEVVQTRLASR